jgi:hypothetical protein
MIVNVCCSGSSGSTLLSTILNRHDDIFSGEELGVFSKPILYEKFNLVKRLSFFISRYGISSSPYFADRSILRNLTAYDLDKKDIWNILQGSDSFVEFVGNLKKSILMNNESVWVEKTPENIFLLKYFLESFSESKVIHIIRDPRDVILSLMNRGLDKRLAAEVWLSSVASIQPFLDKKNVYEIKYEELVLEPVQALNKLCEFIGIPFQQAMVDGATNENRNYFNTWRNQPNDKISTSSVEKFRKSKVNFDEVYSMKITSQFAQLQGTEEFYLIDLMKKYNYDVSGIKFDSYKQKRKRVLPPHKSQGLKGKCIDLVAGYNYSYARVEL